MKTQQHSYLHTALFVFFAGVAIAILAGVLPTLQSGEQQVNTPAPRQWNLTLVNGDNPLPQTFVPETRAIADYPERLFDARAANALEAMLEAARVAGQPLYLVSAYRSIAYQQGLFRRKVSYYKGLGYADAQADEMAARWVARPACSEHNLGLAADIVSADWYMEHSDLTTDFAQTPTYAWLCENAATYGFIVRYPQGSEEITGISFEPWHFRYVGPEAATEIWDLGLCLEEYLALLDERAQVPPVYEPAFG
ncbi:M15 family metallopeptidase [Ruminococcaceae bacterium OttesenSCG-928-N02]|nr:M15 family metallopeptidase [Ruminococcaceae bacterium OttesenSCG-928-N02]